MRRSASYAKPVFALPAVDIIQRGSDLRMRSPRPLEKYERCTGQLLEHWARFAPARSFLAERSLRRSWRHLTYGEALRRVNRVAAWLIEKQCASRPVVILSENSIDHAVLMLACLHIGTPVVPLAPSYSLGAEDFTELRAILRSLDPGLVYVSDHRRFARALDAVSDVHTGKIVSSDDDPSAEGVVPFAALMYANKPTSVKRALARVQPDTLAKVLFTSVSGGEPRGVLTTHRMLCSNQQAIAQVWSCLDDPPVLLDWMPWHQAFGGNQNFNLVLRNGGVLFIDGGRPEPGDFEQTLSNLRDVAPTIYPNTPAAYELLVPALHADKHLRERFFNRLRLIVCEGGSLRQQSYELLQTMGLETVGHRVPVVSSWGSAETGPAAAVASFWVDRENIIGLPIPGTEIKLVPELDRFEARVRGPNVTPGYWKRMDLTASCFDADGFFRTGEAVRFIDAGRPERGLVLDDGAVPATLQVAL